MNIVLFTEIYDCGGIDTFIINLINNWPSENDQFTIIANRSYPGLEIIEKKLQNKCQIIRHDISLFENPNGGFGFLKKLKYILSPVLKYSYFVYNVFALRKVLINRDYDHLMIINGGYPGGDSCRAATITWGIFNKVKPKSIHNFHNIVVPAAFYYAIQENLIDRLISKYTSAFVTVSEAAARSMSLRAFINNNNSVKYIYNGFELVKDNIPEPTDLRKELAIKEGSPLCMILATYEPRKGHFFLLKAFKLVLETIPNAVLLMFGYGFPEEIKVVKSYIKAFELEKNVVLSGFRNDTPNLYRNCDVLLISSQEYESFGLTGIEAMAYKVPIVATNVGGIPEVIKNGYGGFCVDKNNFQDFATKIIILLNDKILRQEVVLKGYSRYETNFTALKMSEKYQNLFHQIANK